MTLFIGFFFQICQIKKNNLFSYSRYIRNVFVKQYRENQYLCISGTLEIVKIYA